MFPAASCISSLRWQLPGHARPTKCLLTFQETKCINALQWFPIPEGSQDKKTQWDSNNWEIHFTGWIRIMQLPLQWADWKMWIFFFPPNNLGCGVLKNLLVLQVTASCRSFAFLCHCQPPLLCLSQGKNLTPLSAGALPALPLSHQPTLNTADGANDLGIMCWISYMLKWWVNARIAGQPECYWPHHPVGQRPEQRDLKSQENVFSIFLISVISM